MKTTSEKIFSPLSLDRVGYAGTTELPIRSWQALKAHSLLTTVEAGSGRGWLRDAEQARNNLGLGPKTISGLRWFDPREIWQWLWVRLEARSSYLTGRLRLD